MEEKNRDEKLSAAILKVALGYRVAEVTEEFAEVDGELKLTKRKRTKKDVPPDLKAVQLLLAENGGIGVEKMSDEQLEQERKRLLALLREQQSETEETEGQVCVETKEGLGTEKKKAMKKSPEKQTAKEEKAGTAEGAEKKTRPKPRKRVVRKKKTEV